jgi:hypothetical protein
MGVDPRIEAITKTCNSIQKEGFYSQLGNNLCEPGTIQNTWHADQFEKKNKSFPSFYHGKMKLADKEIFSLFSYYHQN